ncbi:MAG TPA: KEOPS complex subunit Pcc1 [Nitrososphaera sp.]|nr:KEOPS complex subunit Pcc1 [Nitrososphaera sp.]
MTSKKCKAEITFSAVSKRASASIAAALAPDFSTMPGGSKARVVSRGSRLVIELEADDISDLRASMNSSLLLADVSARCLTL